MASHITRRNLAKGAAWATPVLLASAAVPAYAASQNPQYYGAQSRSIDPDYPTPGECLIDTYIWTTDPKDGEPAGFSFGYEPGKAVDTTATLDSLEFWVAIPRDMSIGGEISPDTSDYWDFAGRELVSNVDYLGADDNYYNDSVSDYYLYRFTFVGDMTNDVRYSGDTTTWPNSIIDVTFHGDTCTYYDEVPVVYSGYVANYTTESGAGGEIYLVGKQSQRP